MAQTHADILLRRRGADNWPKVQTPIAGPPSIRRVEPPHHAMHQPSDLAGWLCDVPSDALA